ncbi:hypothetical protein FRC08_018640 [Ceratobasidium sp. 394]|nr:hypothetical protein FRC08_018640 [Ceratobasidium sp. 394]KAG9087007.1 hypothetical protein FS749_003232 [Ceratobasidium sp. UAMH 11750]
MTFPKGLDASLLPPNEMISFIASQYVRLAGRIFRPFPFAIEEGVVWRVKNSNITRWTMFLGAKITEALLDGTTLKPYND